MQLQFTNLDPRSGLTHWLTASSMPDRHLYCTIAQEGCLTTSIQHRPGLSQEAGVIMFVESLLYRLSLALSQLDLNDWSPGVHCKRDHADLARVHLELFDPYLGTCKNIATWTSTFNLPNVVVLFMFIIHSNKLQHHVCCEFYKHCVVLLSYGKYASSVFDARPSTRDTSADSASRVWRCPQYPFYHLCRW